MSEYFRFQALWKFSKDMNNTKPAVFVQKAQRRFCPSGQSGGKLAVGMIKISKEIVQLSNTINEMT